MRKVILEDIKAAKLSACQVWTFGNSSWWSPVATQPLGAFKDVYFAESTLIQRLLPLSQMSWSTAVEKVRSINGDDRDSAGTSRQPLVAQVVNI